MNTHEYQAKQILQKYGISIPPFGVASNMQEVENVVSDLGLTEAVIKIQVHAGGRGKAGGVKFAKTREEILERAKELIGMKMVNNQTGKEGVIAHQVMITEPVDIEKEYYLGAIIDRGNARPILIASTEGGMEIEEISVKTPEKILKLPILLDGSVKPYHLIRLANFMGWTGDTAKAGMKTAAILAKVFVETDGDLLEINPLVKTKSGKIWAIDAKFSIDDNALYRQKEIATFFDPTQISKNEGEANVHGLAYVSLSGNIGCMVNGAGLAMSTMDIIHIHGGNPANFLDVGGSATKEKIIAGFKIILSDTAVKVILVNIFGGIMNCVTIAQGVIAVVNELLLTIPLIVRLEGTNADEGRKIIKESGLAIISAVGMADAADKVVNSLKD